MSYKKMSFLLLMTLVLFVVVGCGPTTKGKEFKINNTFNITNNTGSIDISPDLATQSGATEQDVVAPTTTTNDVPLDLTIPLSSAASSLQSAIESEVSGKLQEASNDLKPSADVLEPDGVLPVPTVDDVQEPDATTYKIMLRQGEKFGGGKWGTWLDRNGSELSSPFIFSFPECGNATMVVEDVDKAWGADGNPDNTGQMYYFNGNPDIQKDKHMGCSGGCASIFAPQDCELATYALSNQPVGTK